MSSPDRYDHRRLGVYGEDRAQRWYLERGYVLLDRNWRCPDGELDLVGRVKGNEGLVVVEVRARKEGGMQITAKNSTEVSDYGMNNTSSLEKTVTSVVNVSFSIE